MKAMAADQFGAPDVLALTERPDPPVGPDTVLVSVRAAGVNPVDWQVLAGSLKDAFPTHFPLIPGWDVAGIVAEVGPAVTEFRPGDAVIGYVRRDDVQFGSFAELVPAPVRCLAALPENVDIEAAAGLPLAGLTADQALDAVDVYAAETVLIHAAAGGVGSFAVQLAVHRGARVIGTASEANHDHLRQLGAEPVAYGEGMVQRVRELAGGKVDAVLDLVGGEALDTACDVVADPRRIASIVDPEGVRRLGGRYVFARPAPAGLERLANMLGGDTLVVHVAERRPMAEAAQALRASMTGHTRGKLILTM